MITFEFSLYSKRYSKLQLLNIYSIEYLNDWLSYESEIKYLFFFGALFEDSYSLSELENNYDIKKNIDLVEDSPKNSSQPEMLIKNTYLNEIFNLLKSNEILSNNEKAYILSLYIDDAYVFNRNNEAILKLTIKSEALNQLPSEKIVKFLCNHIYNSVQYGFLKNGIIQPLSEAQKQQYEWTDEINWSLKFTSSKNYDIGQFDFLLLSDFTYIFNKDSTVKILSKPIYISNYNLECYNISKSIDQLNIDILRYKKSIHFLKKKKEELKKKRKELYKKYKNTYISMLSEPKTLWKEEENAD
jgi:hypothetical protein